MAILVKQMIISKMYSLTKMVQTNKQSIHLITLFIKIIKIYLRTLLIQSIIVQLMKVHQVYLTNKMILCIIIKNLLKLIKVTIKFQHKCSIKEIC